MLEERELLINPVVTENVAHNTKTITDVRSLTASVFGIAAGIIGFESYAGFIFYFVGSFFVSLLMFMFMTGSKPASYFRKTNELWTTEVFGGSSLAAFVLTWTLFYNLVRA